MCRENGGARDRREKYHRPSGSTGNETLQLQTGGFEGGGEIGEAFALGVGLEVEDGAGGKLYGLAKLAEGLAAGADAHTAVREDGTGRIEVVEHVTTGVEAGFEVGGGGFSRGGGGRFFSLGRERRAEMRRRVLPPLG